MSLSKPMCELALWLSMNGTAWHFIIFILTEANNDIPGPNLPSRAATLLEGQNELTNILC